MCSFLPFFEALTCEDERLLRGTARFEVEFWEVVRFNTSIWTSVNKVFLQLSARSHPLRWKSFPVAF